MNKEDKKTLQTFVNRFECIENCVENNAPFPAQELSEAEITNTLYVIAQYILKKERQDGSLDTLYDQMPKQQKGI